MQLTGQLQPLDLSARQGTGGLSQSHIAQAYFLERLERRPDVRLLKERQRLLHGQSHHLLNGLFPIGIA